MRRLLAISIMVLVVWGVLSAPQVLGKDSHTLFELHNNARTEQGIAKLAKSKELKALAKKHSRRMAQQQRLYHTRCLPCGVHGKWTTLGENVGVGNSVWSLNRAFMRSKPHRRNILCGCYTKVGIGVVRDSHSRLWVTVRFRG